MRPGLWVGGSLVPPAVLPILVVYLVVAFVWLRRARRVAARAPERAPLAPTVERVLLLGAVTLTLAATLTPPAVIDYPELFGSRQCRLHRPELAASLLEGQRLLNVLLLVPVGLLGVLVARRLRGVGRALVIGGVLVLPALVEALQWAFPAIRRACDATDLVDNYLGVGAGLLAGLAEVVLRWAARRKGGRVAP